ncbi:hypothetical protein BDW02DRAFT_590517 [Decorospora gaudefroyi]|uniref:Uncharacterized protein n=1 Tax=Decorospora gaudefroyi TaxID=184978 RepID=A0A6A5KB19_9PLEO|nr:hypothetical protein BDW02DRAFT_590517 [Decorospora gaudefroyi]
MAEIIDHRRIRSCTPAELRDYYKQLAGVASLEDITSGLLQAVARGSISPLTFAPWLGVSKSPATIREALIHDKSVLIRKFAIKQLGRALSSSRWKEIWDGIGGTAGLLDIFAGLSVLEVRDACKAIGRFGRGKDLVERRERCTELFKGLQPEHFTGAPHKTKDQRPLTRHYRLLIPACSEELVGEAVEAGLKGAWKSAREEDLLRYHPEIMQKKLLRSLGGDQTQQPIQSKLEDLFTRYPSATSRISRFSASMEFSLIVLRRLVKSTDYAMKEDLFIDQLVRPLLERAIKKRADWYAIQEIVNLTVQYLETYPSAGKEITIEVRDVLHLVARCWSRKPDLFEKQLRRLCSHPLFGTAKKDKLNDWDHFLAKGVVRTRRYSLLRLCYQESTALDLDVDGDLEKVKGPLCEDILTNLGHREALLLFARLREVRGDVDLVEHGSRRSVLGMTSSSAGSDGDPDLYHIHLLSLNGKNEEARVLATESLNTRKKKAASTSQPEERAFYAKSSLYIAIASGSLEILKQTLDWTKRFIGDPLVLRELHMEWYPDEAERLLSGVPEPITKSLTLADLHQRVEMSNSILASLFDTVCSASREPSFSSNHWKGVFGLCFDSIRRRIELTSELKKRLHASKEELYDCLWKGTIPTLIAMEAKANAEGNEKLQANHLEGIMAYHYGSSSMRLKDIDVSSYTFMDNLARARDDLWCRLRSSVHPLVLTLPEPLPHGLPVQYLTASWYMDVQDLDKHTPYIASRVHETLFPDPAAALQVASSDYETQAAIGVFVDSYQDALQRYIPNICERAEKHRRAQKAWEYAIGPLSRGRMNEEEAVRFWKNKTPVGLKNWPPGHSINHTRATWPLIPKTDDPHTSCEWNPFTSVPPHSRNLDEPTYLDLSLAVLDVTHPNPTIYHTLDVVSPEVPAEEGNESTIWSSKCDMGEGGVLSALLYLNAKYVADCRLLAKPFPCADDARYPALYLDEEFLSSDELNPLEAVRNIRGNIGTIPPSLLEQVARNVIKALDGAKPNTSTYTTLHEVALLLIVRLGESDEPALAMRLAIRTILDRPKSSSWHRQLLSPSFLRRLPASKAKTCIDTFAHDVILTLKAKKNTKEKREGDNIQEGSHSSPYVKITAIKFMVQLLHDGNLVGIDQSLSLLSAISETDPHVDVRVSIVKCLLELLKVSSPRHSSHVLALLESAVPLAGSLNERQPLTEDMWAQSEEDLLLPDRLKDIAASPVLDALITHFHHSESDVNDLQPFVERIILPVLGRLKKQTARWVSLFLRKYGVEDHAQLLSQFPPLPRDPLVNERLLAVEDSRLSCLPRAVLEEYVTFITFNVAPPAPIRALNNRLRKDHTVNSRTEVQTWLSLYGKGLDALDALYSFGLISLLAHVSESPDGTCMTARVIQEQFLKLFTAVLWNDTPTYVKLTHCVCWEILSSYSLSEHWWTPHGKPILEAMISYVNTLRTRDWERDQNRKPSVLPDTFSWRLLLLDYPWPSSNDKATDRERKCLVFANQLSGIVDEISSLPIQHTALDQLFFYLASDNLSCNAARPTRRHFSRLLNYHNRDALHEALINNRILTAVYLGDITKPRLSWLTGPELLRVDVASDLVMLVKTYLEENEGVVDEDVRAALRGLVESWKGSDNEGVRRRGWKIEMTYTA